MNSQETLLTSGALAPGVARARRRGVSEGDVPPSEVGNFLKMKLFGAIFFAFFI